MELYIRSHTPYFHLQNGRENIYMCTFFNTFVKEIGKNIEG